MKTLGMILLGILMSGCATHWRQEAWAKKRFSQAHMECQTKASNVLRTAAGPYQPIDVTSWNMFMRDCMETEGYTID